MSQPVFQPEPLDVLILGSGQGDKLDFPRCDGHR
jgi:hypothetical protein